MNLLERVLEHEGFRARPYQDHLGVWTIGHGLTWLNEKESARIVDERLEAIRQRLWDEHIWLRPETTPMGVTNVLIEMVFQMGWTGCHNFKNMWAAMELEDWTVAADEMLDSRWAKQTPNRAKELSGLIREEAG